jgi:hypothetical protein
MTIHEAARATSANDAPTNTPPHAEQHTDNTYNMRESLIIIAFILNKYYFTKTFEVALIMLMDIFKAPIKYIS